MEMPEYFRIGTTFVDSESNLIYPLILTNKGLRKIRDAKLDIMNDRFIGIVPEYLSSVRFKYTPSGLPYIYRDIENIKRFFSEK